MESRMREIRTSGLTRGSNAAGHPVALLSTLQSSTVRVVRSRMPNMEWVDKDEALTSADSARHRVRHTATLRVSSPESIIFQWLEN